MVITVPAQQTQPLNGPRPINLNKDLPQVMRLLEHVFNQSLSGSGQRFLRDGMGLGDQPAFLWRLNPATSKLAMGTVWEEDGRIIANATIIVTNTTGRYLVVNVAVHPDHRRRGIARILMDSVIDTIRVQQGRQILLQVVKENVPAVDLYKSLQFTTISHITVWHNSMSRIREIPSAIGNQRNPHIRELRRHEWQAAYELDQTSLHPDLNWPELLSHDVYKKGFWRWLDNFFNGRHSETWVITNLDDQLIGMASIWSEWGRAHQVTIRVHPAWRGHLERPLLAKAIRRLHYLPRRNIRLNHPDDDQLMNQLLHEANFQIRRTLTHMRLKI